MLIIYFLNNSFKLFYCTNIIISGVLRINNIDFRIDSNSKKNKGFIGFFDWLRIEESTIVGIRICYLEQQLYNKILMQFPYVIPTFENKCMEILFKGNRYNSELSGDQDFTNNYVYKSQANDFIFTFGLDHLTENELSSLLKNCEVLNENDLLGSPRSR